MEELKVAKIKLYLLLLAKPSDKMTSAERNTCYELARDADIQAILEEHLKKIKKRG